MLKLIHNWKAAIAWLMLALVVGLAINLSASHTARTVGRSAAIAAVTVQHQTDLAACYRSNRLRRIINERVGNTKAQSAILYSFLLSASKARYANYAITHEPGDLVAAQRYHDLAIRQAKIQDAPVPILDCPKVYPKPPLLR